MNTNTRVNRISCVPQPDGSIDMVIPAGIAAEFKQLVRRATHTWQDQSAEMRDFADRILGRADSVGACMKQEIFGYPVIGAKVEVQPKTLCADAALAKRSCCGTLLRDPHHNQCQEVTGKYISSVVPKRSCCDTYKNESHTSQCKYLKEHLNSQCVNRSELKASGIQAKCFCDGHPETCNCSYHCR